MKSFKKRVGTKELKQLMIRRLEKNSYSSAEAILIANEFVENELLGKDQFGVKVFERLMSYDTNKKKTKLSVKTSGPITIVDAGGRFAHCASKEALKAIKNGVKKYGVHVLAIKNCTTFIKAGYLVKRIVDLGFIGISFLFVNSKFAGVGGIKEPVFGSNPISIGIPCGNESFVYDASTSMLSGGALNKLRESGTDFFDQTLGIDENGALTSSIKRLKTVLPVGGNRGLGLMMAVELLAGSMLGYKVGSKKGTYTADNGILVISIDPSRFGNAITFSKNNENFIKTLRAMSEGKVHIPGEGYSSLSKNFKFVSIDEDVLNSLRKEV